MTAAERQQRHRDKQSASNPDLPLARVFLRKLGAAHARERQSRYYEENPTAIKAALFLIGVVRKEAAELARLPIRCGPYGPAKTPSLALTFNDNEDRDRFMLPILAEMAARMMEDLT